MSIAEAFDPDSRWGRAFGVVDRKNYSPPLYQHRGQDIRKTDPTGSYSVPTDVVSLSSGVVSHVYTARSTGREIVVDTGRRYGRYEIHCHNAPGHAPKETRVDAGGWLAVNATRSQNPGTGWTAPHDHLVISDYPDAAHTPSRPVYDPRGFIRAALTATAAGGATPFNPEEEDMTPEQAAQLDQIYQAVRKPYGSELEAIINILRTEHAPILSAILTGRTMYPGTNWNLAETLVNVMREDDGRPMPSIDSGEVAAELAPLLAPLVSGGVRELSDEQIAVIAAAVNDEADRRERERLGG